jgi:hypothetical protein
MQQLAFFGPAPELDLHNDFRPRSTQILFLRPAISAGLLIAQIFAVADIPFILPFRQSATSIHRTVTPDGQVIAHSEHKWPVRRRQPVGFLVRTSGSSLRSGSIGELIK